MAKKYTNIDLEKYKNGYKSSDRVNTAWNQKTGAEDAVKNYGDFSYYRQDDLDKIIDSVLNRDKFSYDLNGDALYNQYKDQYRVLGQQAMTDTIGQASALTGGYGNSYAVTAGNQAYQSYLQQLNNKIPELYQIALDRYNAETDQLYNQYGLLSSDKSDARNAWNDKYNALLSDRDYYANNYNNLYTNEYNAWNDNRNYDTSQYWNEYKAGYQAEQDAIANQLARDQLNEQIASRKASERAADQSKEIESLKAQLNSANSAEPFVKANLSYINNNGQYIYLQGGKEIKTKAGENPYTFTTNSDVLDKNGKYDPSKAFKGTPYQPNNIEGHPLEKTGEKAKQNGVWQNVWKTPDGTKWVWNGVTNEYERY